METTAFVEEAEDRLATIRGSLLLFTQGRLSGREIIPACHKLAQLQLDAEAAGLITAGRLAAEAAYSIEHLSRAAQADHANAARRPLDLIAQLEAELLQVPLASGDFFSDVDALLETSFEELAADPDETSCPEEFEIDEETLEVFREEGEGLIANISKSLETLRNEPGDSNALWEIRRNAHTFKGAAGIVGLTNASELAHVIEDLLDRLVNSGEPASERKISAVAAAVACLSDMVAAREAASSREVKDALIAVRDDSVSAHPSAAKTEDLPPIHTPPTPVVRVSLDRLDELMALSSRLTADIEVIQRHIVDGANNEAVGSLLSAQRDICTVIQRGLQQIRMVRFGVLEMRLNRTVHVTCQDEGKLAAVEILDPDVEVDTLVIDALIEPLLHLLKNAVVHGIERPETRRLIGKPEKGSIKVRVSTDGEIVTLSVEDDGRGISTSKLIERAVSDGRLAPEAAERLPEDEARRLIFERGLTTAGSLNMNAGRGVGMGIVKESVESRGGSVTTESEPQQGTRFTLEFPVRPIADAVAETAAVDLPLILVVDDSDSVRRMTAKIVASPDRRVITAANGAEALELLLSGAAEPDLILSDVEMPVMDGWEFLEYIKTDEHHGHIPVVMVTSLDAPEHRAKAERLGASAYLLKPFSLHDLEREVVPLIQRTS